MRSVLFLLLLSAFAAHASPGEKFIFDGVDITPLVRFYESKTEVLAYPVRVYSWSQAAAIADREDTLPFAQAAAQTFWQTYGHLQSDEQSMVYGHGLYAAFDPVSTVEFGGGQGNWLLLQIQLPPGLRFFAAETSPPKGGKEAKSYHRLHTQFDCVSPLGGDTLFEPQTFFKYGGKHLSPKCRQLGEKIFKDILKIDALAYWYPSGIFEACPYVSQALVLMRDAWMTRGNITYFNRRSVHAPQDRQIIQTLFMIAGARSTALDGPITAAEADETAAKRLLWSDLEGQPKFSSIHDWLKSHRIGCGDGPTFGPLSRIPSRQ